MSVPLNDYGSGQSGLVIVDQEGPYAPPVEAVEIAYAALSGAHPQLPIPCMDCLPNLVLKDSLCPDCGRWEWGLIVAHDDTCPRHTGSITPAPRED